MALYIVDLEDAKNNRSGHLYCATKRRLAIFHSPASMELKELKPGKDYLIVPVSLNCLGVREEGREYVITVYTRKKIHLIPRDVSSIEVGHILALACRKSSLAMAPFRGVGIDFFEVCLALALYGLSSCV